MSTSIQRTEGPQVGALLKARKLEQKPFEKCLLQFIELHYHSTKIIQGTQFTIKTKLEAIWTKTDRKSWNALTSSCQLQHKTSRDRPKSAPRSSFLNMQRTLFSNVYHFLSAEKYPQRIRIRLRNHVFPNWKQKIHFRFFFGSLIVPKKNFQPKNYLSQAEIRYERGRVLFDQKKYLSSSEISSSVITFYKPSHFL